MELPKKIARNEQTVRIASTIALAVIAIRSFLKGNRLRGLLAAGGAVAIGATTSTLEPTPLAGDEVVDVTVEDDGMQCAVCNEPIVLGESRRPNADDKTVHEACL